MHQAFYQQGMAKVREGNWEQAIEQFDQALDANPNFAEAYYQRGLAQFKLGNGQAAVNDYTRALLSDAENPRIYYARGLAHLAIGKTEYAVADAKQAILLNPTDAEAYRVLAAARRQQGAIQKAVNSYQKAAELYLDQPDVANCRYCLEQIRALQPDRIPDAGSIATPSTSFSSETFINQATAKAKQRNHRSALEDLNWVIQLDPGDVQAYIHRGQILADLRDWRGAIADYHQAARIFLDRADKTNAQNMLDRIQQLKTAQTEAARSVRRTPSNVVMFPTRSVPPRELSAVLRYKLQSLVGDDRRIVAGLVDRLKLKHPGMPEEWYWGKAIYDLERDRR
ncbi:tetratricopeptide repeat protein [Egbenema bharatensis]|uniref:tetratricopeptide repeat protein n=1 Tax=Egbenema bharatensis TaxID=3463334 RepID=UPI003A84A008